MPLATLPEPRPEVDAPGDRPTCGQIPAQLERAPRGGGQRRRAPQADLAARIYAVEMRHVPVIRFGRLHVPTIEPFLELPGLADPVGRQTGARRRARSRKLLVEPK